MANPPRPPGLLDDGKLNIVHRDDPPFVPAIIEDQGVDHEREDIDRGDDVPCDRSQRD